jgi:hypothetical protein
MLLCGQKALIRHDLKFFWCTSNVPRSKESRKGRMLLSLGIVNLTQGENEISKWVYKDPCFENLVV